MDPAMAVNIVLPFLVRRLFNDKLKAVRKFILVFLLFVIFSLPVSLPLKGFESSVTLPSCNFIIRVE